MKEDKLNFKKDEESAAYTSDMVEESVIEDVKVWFLPKLEHICDKLEETDNDVCLILSSTCMSNFPI